MNKFEKYTSTSLSKAFTNNSCFSPFKHLILRRNVVEEKYPVCLFCLTTGFPALNHNILDTR